MPDDSLVTSIPSYSHALEIDEEQTNFSKFVHLNAEKLKAPQSHRVSTLRPLPKYPGPPVSLPWTGKPQGLVVHYTGSPTTGGLRWLLSRAAKASVHFGIDRRGQLYQLLPLDRAAAHAGISTGWRDGKLTRNANGFTFGVEICNAGTVEEDDGEYYYEVGRSLRRYSALRYGCPQTGSLRIGNFDSGAKEWQPYQPRQILAVIDLAVFLFLRSGQTDFRSFTPEEFTTTRWKYEARPESFVIYGHETIARPTGRKIDPGPLFPWTLFKTSTAKILEHLLEEER